MEDPGAITGDNERTSILPSKTIYLSSLQCFIRRDPTEGRFDHYNGVDTDEQVHMYPCRTVHMAVDPPIHSVKKYILAERGRKIDERDEKRRKDADRRQGATDTA